MLASTPCSSQAEEEVSKDIIYNAKLGNISTVSSKVKESPYVFLVYFLYTDNGNSQMLMEKTGKPTSISS